MPRILLLNFGSLGDLHPFIGMALILKRAGYEVSIGSNRSHCARIEAAGIRAHAIGPDLDPQNAELVKVVMTPLRGPELLHRKYIFPASEQSIAEALPLAQNTDLILTGILGYFIPTLSELTGVPWGMAMLAPLGYWSAYDPPELPSIPFLRPLKFMGPRFYKYLYRGVFGISRSWSAPLQAARSKRGLSAQANPLAVTTQTSGHLNLALFSKHFAHPQPDWPHNLKQIGFIAYDGPESHDPLAHDLEEFLAAGEAPLLMTLGSTNVLEPGQLYDHFHAAVVPLKKRAIISVATKTLEFYKNKHASDSVFVTDYVPYGKIMPRCQAIVHQGGVGTTGHCLRAGKPAVILASVNDQVDNARHVEEIGAGLKLSPKKLTPAILQRALEKVLSPEMVSRAETVGQAIRSEDSEKLLLSAIAEFFRQRGPEPN